MAGPAPIYSLATDDHARAEATAWARFSSARDAAEFCASWLAILCAQVGRVNGALLLLGPERDGAFRAAASWPDATRNMQYLAPAAEKALNERRGVLMPRDAAAPPAREPGALVGYPIEVSGTLRGAVALDLSGGEHALQQALRLVYWASAWLVDQFRQQDLKERDTRLARLALATDLVASALQERRLAPSALAVANELAARLKCDRVSLGFEESGSVEVQAISHTASFDRKTNLVRLIGEAMDEVLDLDATIVHPARDGDELGAIAHGELAREFRDLAAGECRVSAKTVMEGEVQRAAVAPFDGYVAQSLVRAGDTVKKGQVLARLDERELKLEQTRLASEREQLMRKHRQAFAALDRATMAVIAAQINQAEAQLSLVEDKLARATLAAPFDGIVVSGDLSQLLGAPVEQGKVLFQIAPLDAYRVILEVDERDIAHVRIGQQGAPALSGMPAQPMHFALEPSIPVSPAEAWSN